MVQRSDKLNRVLKGWRFVLVLLLAGCNSEPAPENTPPTVVFTVMPGVISDCDSVRFAWMGNDVDGQVVGYYYGLDDSIPNIWTESTAVAVYNLSFGEHLFYLQAVDDAGARSIIAVAPFRVDFPGAISALGTETTFEIATWNIQNFPKKGDSTLMLLRMIIPRLDVDLYCIQEIEDTIAFRTMLATLSEYDGTYSRDDYGSSYQKTGIIYKRGIVTVSNVRQIFWNNENFPRPPLVMDVVASNNGRSFDFCLIVLHLKAGFNFSDRQRRANACRLLKEYIDNELRAGGEQDFLVVGDWNDRLDSPFEENVFLPFLEDTIKYCFLTLPIAGNSFYASLISSGVLIDHILITRDALNEYSGGRTITLRLDDEVSGYLRLISDHRPVIAIFPVVR